MKESIKRAVMATDTKAASLGNAPTTTPPPIDDGEIGITDEFLATATLREKAVRYCRTLTERKVSSEEFAALSESIRKPSERKEWEKCIRHHNVLISIFPALSLAQAMYYAEAGKTAEFLRIYDAYMQEESTINAICDKLRQSGDDKAAAIVCSAVEGIPHKYATIRAFTDELDDDVVLFDCTDLFEGIRQRATKSHKVQYEYFKAGIHTIENWVEARRAWDFVPRIMRETIENGKRDYCEGRGLERYSRARLLERKRRGEQVSAVEEQLAIFPCFEEIRPEAEILDMWADKLEEYEFNGKR